ncbi:ubiquinol oxidase subunit II [Pseudomonas aeruginosa]|uniref:ubiquinol oxidase subunit II n=1 Tax=Pseudomonas aeruginosa TaxID=287 RepID=UPI00068B0556|nr:ubiquinol oxidase subunit II [Pseudomonas aeruginosa]MBX6190327.1 ubiquinol oxidase subunit II [Pseudomonas aeruginosa]MBX6717001.1 ubiquinol oxidase subunit II [Pseudomonas aeruginosa]MBX6872480.1 ubiquinol oxidase subunit II [Pseudomonas aeruginosa]QKL12951.1 ubiquinol oxidase subunit II [Pseudomonas aeruginosa]QQV96126.1 ubiquinol oxidase subunit II [Pseudomonas aeruginosa]
MKIQPSRYLKGMVGVSPLLLSGCKMALFDPKGQIGIDEKSLIITATLLMLLVVIPVMCMTLVFAWKYRASNTKATYRPDWAHSNRIEVVVWTIPCVIIAFLGWMTWKSTHALDPYRPLDSEVKPVTIEVVSLDWKWLFIYPEQGIATLNEIAFPKDTPVNFRLTSDTVMNSFFIPQLGSQIYTMSGMQTKLHLIANEEGVFDGISANYSGAGFSGMKFKAIATSQQGFQDWVAKVRAAPASLTAAGYAALARPSENVPATYFSSVDPQLFQQVLSQHERAETASQSNPSIQE